MNKTDRYTLQYAHAPWQMAIKRLDELLKWYAAHQSLISASTTGGTSKARVRDVIADDSVAADMNNAEGCVGTILMAIEEAFGSKTFTWGDVNKGDYIKNINESEIVRR